MPPWPLHPLGVKVFNGASSPEAVGLENGVKMVDDDCGF